LCRTGRSWRSPSLPRLPRSAEQPIQRTGWRRQSLLGRC
jgi:hypothetical protein